MWSRNQIRMLTGACILTLSQLIGSAFPQGSKLPPKTTSEVAIGESVVIINHLSDFEDFGDVSKFLPTGLPVYSIDDSQLPKVRDQDFAPICTLFCATGLLEIEDCRRRKLKQCNRLSDEQRISVVGMKIFSDNVGRPKISRIGPIPYEHREVYEILNKISAASHTVILYSESCLSYEHFVSRFVDGGRPNVAARVEAFFVELKAKFLAAQAENMATRQSPTLLCKECQAVSEMFRQYFGIASKPSEVRQALSRASFNEFLFSMIFDETLESNPSCKELHWEKVSGYPVFDHFPETTAEATTLDELFNVLEEKIKSDTPVALSGLCTSQDKHTKNCTSHCFIVTGLRTLRDATTGEYIKLMRVRSSSGERWQSANNDGWVRVNRLKQLMITSDDTRIELNPSDRRKVFANLLSWLRQP